MTFLGVARANDTVATPSAFINGIPVYERPLRFNFSIIVEGKPGPSRRPVGTSSFNWNPGDPAARPDLQVILSMPLGDGSLAVCDTTPPELGGVPAAASFAETQPVSDALNDFGCRFLDGSGNPRGRGPADACTRFPDGEFRFVAAGSTIQYCSGISDYFSFPVGDTLVTARLRDVAGDVSEPLQMVIRVTPK